ncbi:MAG: hypothetical protein ACLFUH_01750 [Bacteroidales bacterium]
MADKSRTVNTKFWTDSYIEQLNPSEKLLFLYCLTSPQSNLLGIYEVSESRIKFETGLPLETIRKAFERFGNDKKVFYKHNFIIIPKFLEHQRLNNNMKIGVTKLISDLPKWLKQEIFGNGLKGLGNDSKSFETIRNTLLKLEMEIESERESEKGKKKPFHPPSKEDIKEYFKENGYDPEIGEKAFNYYDSANWHDSKGNKIKNWKQKMQGVWFREEHKISKKKRKMSQEREIVFNKDGTTSYKDS